jgi:hypothetical protein
MFFFTPVAAAKNNISVEKYGHFLYFYIWGRKTYCHSGAHFKRDSLTRFLNSDFFIKNLLIGLKICFSKMAMNLPRYLPFKLLKTLLNHDSPMPLTAPN